MEGSLSQLNFPRAFALEVSTLLEQVGKKGDMIMKRMLLIMLATKISVEQFQEPRVRGWDSELASGGLSLMEREKKGAKARGR